MGARRSLRKLLNRFRAAPKRHPVVRTVVLKDVKIIEIAREISVPLKIDSRGDSGYHGYGNDWWLNPACPISFQYLSLDALYPAPYFFDEGIGHPDHKSASDLVEYMEDIYSRVFGRRIESVLELGSGGGEITAEFLRRGVDFITVEGTSAGVEKLREQGIPEGNIVKANLKFLPNLGRKFDLVMCTEVAEHLEPFFASKLAESCIVHSDAVWFSAADRLGRPHYHHINEQWIQVWDNLFAHMGLPAFVELNGMHGRASRLYLKSQDTWNSQDR